MRVPAPNDIKGKELFEYLRKNKKEIFRSKKAVPFDSDTISSFAESESESLIISKSFTEKAEEETEYGKPFIKTPIGNLCGWCDSYEDVSLKGSFNRTAKNNGDSMYFLHDHDPSIKAQIARNEGVSVQQILLSDIGIQSDVLMQEAIVMRGLFDIDLDPRAYYLYYHNMIKEHSIKLQYVDIVMAINDPDGDKEDYKAWVDLFPQVINKDKVERQGFFYGIKEQKVFEFSGVLWGANSQTPVIPNKTTPKIEPVIIDTSKTKDSVNKRNLFIYS